MNNMEYVTQTGTINAEPSLQDAMNKLKDKVAELEKQVFGEQQRDKGDQGAISLTSKYVLIREEIKDLTIVIERVISGLV